MLLPTPAADHSDLTHSGIAALSVSIVIGMTSNALFLAAFQFQLDWFGSRRCRCPADQRRPSCCDGRLSST